MIFWIVYPILIILPHLIAVKGYWLNGKMAAAKVKQENRQGINDTEPLFAYKDKKYNGKVVCSALFFQRLRSRDTCLPARQELPSDPHVL